MNKVIFPRTFVPCVLLHIYLILYTDVYGTPCVPLLVLNSTYDPRNTGRSPKWFKKNSTCGGLDRPHGIVLRRKFSHTYRENLWTPTPPVYSGPLLVRRPVHNCGPLPEPEPNCALDMGRARRFFLHEAGVEPLSGSFTTRCATNQAKAPSPPKWFFWRNTYI